MAARSICSRAGLLCRVGAVHDVLKPTTAAVAAAVFGSSRTMATEAKPTSFKVLPAEPPAPSPFAIRRAPTILATIYSFPTMEPLRFDQFANTFLHAPLRRDILHKAVVYEGDAHRLGRANTKWRTEVHGSSRKIRPQKGSGKARLGDRKSPMLRGGGAAHGPKPRDFSSGLPRKMYDMAWRTAISFRYRRDELIVVDEALELNEPDAGLISTILTKYGWGSDHSRSLLITAKPRANLEAAMLTLGSEGRVLTAEEVDVKDILEMGRVIIERDALVWFEQEHGVDAN